MIMKTMLNIKKTMLIATMALIGTTAFAQRGHYGHYGHRGHVYHSAYYHPSVITVVNRPVVTSRTSNRLSKQDRLDMALAYLKNNKTLSISRYSKMTGLAKATAEAELDTFVISKSNPIKMVMDGKKKLYMI